MSTPSFLETMTALGGRHASNPLDKKGCRANAVFAKVALVLDRVANILANTLANTALATAVVTAIFVFVFAPVAIAIIDIAAAHASSLRTYAAPAFVNRRCIAYTTRNHRSQTE